MASADPAADFRAAVCKATGGYAPERIEPGKLHRFPTSGRRGDNAGYCKLYEDQRGGFWGDHRTGASGRWQAPQLTALAPAEQRRQVIDMAAKRAEREAGMRAQWAEAAKRIEHQWSQCVPLVEGDPVMLYMQRRGLADSNHSFPQVLRHHPHQSYWEGTRKLGEFPAMVAPLVAPSGTLVALHRTFLTLDGRKADVPHVKKLTPAAGPLDGASIPLFFKPLRGCMGIAEGIETAIAATRLSGVPTVAAYCAHSMQTWRWPAGVQRLVIFADADNAGREAANVLRQRALAAHLNVNLLLPTGEGADWCDVWAQRENSSPPRDET